MYRSHEEILIRKWDEAEVEEKGGKGKGRQNGNMEEKVRQTAKWNAGGVNEKERKKMHWEIIIMEKNI